MTAGIRKGPWELIVWGRNILDDYQVVSGENFLDLFYYTLDQLEGGSTSIHGNTAPFRTYGLTAGFEF